MAEVDKGAVVKKIKSHVKENKISCKQVMKIAEELNISPRDLGTILNEEKIKIISCQLGCFP